MDVVIFLKNQLEERKSKNPSYSIRAFARDLKISPGRLVDILNYRVNVGPRLLERIAERLKLSDAEVRALKDIHTNEKQNRKLHGSFNRSLSDGEYALIVAPIHYDILSLLETKDFNSDPRWIAKRLGKTVHDVNEALNNLLSLNLIKKTSKGTLKLVTHGVTTTNNIPSDVIKEAHRVVLHEALRSLDEHDLDERDFSGITMAINVEKLDEAKEMIRAFRRKLCKFLETGKKTEVYTLRVQLFPKTVRQSTK
ncbi:MAG TPA: TIGR02147 family protein [Bdellovibrio sp.]|uniref:TIGR02147 family protein n=1 Tax=Bdellovibrio sp. TaxID=28201 RepID=UPI002F24B24C